MQRQNAVWQDSNARALPVCLPNIRIGKKNRNIQGGEFHIFSCSSMMAAQQQDQQGVSPFPTPPSMFYKLYTDERMKSGQVPKPPAPVKGTYTMFGAPFNVLLVLYV
jgi:hypothetical protein